MATQYQAFTNLDPLLRTAVQKLVDTYQPRHVYLFGSRARGSAQSGSDYDLLLVVPDDSPSELKSSGKAYQSLWGINVPLDVLVWTSTDFNKRLHIANSLPAVVVREGKLLHDA